MRMAVIRPDRTHSQSVPRVTCSRLITSTVLRKFCLARSSSIKLMSPIPSWASIQQPVKVNTQIEGRIGFIEETFFELVRTEYRCSRVDDGVDASAEETSG
jgi:hypothetical protein